MARFLFPTATTLNAAILSDLKWWKTSKNTKENSWERFKIAFGEFIEYPLIKSKEWAEKRREGVAF